jgi:DNA-binding transcriptional LysR family regulator
MELHHLHTFVTVAAAGSITGAAAQLHTTPSGVSMNLKALEDELGVRLFVRTARGVTLTEAGERLRVQAQQTLTSAQALTDQARALRGKTLPQARVGLNASSTFLRAAALIASAHEIGLDLHIVSGNSRQVLDGLRGETLDLGFVFGAVQDAALTAHPLCVAELVIAAPLAWANRLTDWESAAGLAWIYGDGYCPFQEIVDRLFAERGLAYNKALQSDDETTKSELVTAGVGVTLLERSEAEQAASQGKLALWMIPETPPITCALSLVHRRVLSPELRLLRDAVLRAWRG